MKTERKTNKLGALPKRLEGDEIYKNRSFEYLELGVIIQVNETINIVAQDDDLLMNVLEKIFNFTGNDNYRFAKTAAKVLSISSLSVQN